MTSASHALVTFFDSCQPKAGPSLFGSLLSGSESSFQRLPLLVPSVSLNQPKRVLIGLRLPSLPGRRESVP